MSPQRSLTRPVGRLRKDDLQNKYLQITQMLDAVEKQKAALLAEMAQREAQPDLTKANPDEYRLEFQRADRKARRLHKMECEFKAPAIYDEFNAIGCLEIYEKICKILNLDYLAADTNALQCKLMWYACELANYECQRDECVEYVKCELESTGIHPDDLPCDISDWINMVIFNVA